MNAMQPILVPTLDELSVEFERLLAIVQAADAACRAGGETHELSLAYDAASGPLIILCGQVAMLPAQTLAHVRLKARVLDWYSFVDGQEPRDTEDRLAFQLVRALVDGLPGEAG